jgi:hypothetical protein
MIEAQITRGPDGKVVSFSVRGHSRYAPRGRDIVCAAVSAVVQTAVIGLKSTPGVEVRDWTDEGKLECAVVDVRTPEAVIRADAITSAMVEGLKSIESAHSKYVTVKVRDIEEVSICS